MKIFEGPGLIIILVIVLIIFGPKQLPQLGKSLGKTFKSIRDGVEGKDEDGVEGDETAAKAEAKDEAKKPAETGAKSE
jgi:sec-independent protein translocase protein TatA